MLVLIIKTEQIAWLVLYILGRLAELADGTFCSSWAGSARCVTRNGGLEADHCVRRRAHWGRDREQGGHECCCRAAPVRGMEGGAMGWITVAQR